MDLTTVDLAFRLYRHAVHQGGICVVSVDGDIGPVRVATGSTFRWSPAGTHLAFVFETFSAGFVYEELYFTSGSGDPIELCSWELLPNWVWSPDGTRLAFPRYRALCVASTEADGWIEVSGGLDLDAYVGFTWSPDGARLAFVAGPWPDLQLYVARGDGVGEPVAVSGPCASAVEKFQWSPDGTQLAFLGNKDDAAGNELYVAPADGGVEPIKVSGSLERSRWPFRWSPDGTLLAFVAREDADDVRELYVTTAAGDDEPVKVSGAMESGGVVRSLWWVSAGGRIAFEADKDADEENELYLASPEGDEEPVKVSGQGAVKRSGPSPDKTRVGFIADKDTEGVNQLYVVSAEGNDEAVNVSGTLVAGGNVACFWWSPDGTLLAFVADKDTDEVDELYVAPADGSEDPIKVSGTLLPGGSVEGRDWRRRWSPWSPDGSRLAFISDKDGSGVSELYVASPDGAAEPIKVSGTVAPSHKVTAFEWSPLSD